MKRIFTALVAVALAVGLSGAANASIVGSYFNFGERNEVRDDSVGVLIKPDGTPSDLRAPAIGDLLLGIFSLNDFTSETGPDISVPGEGTTVWGIYALELDSFITLAPGVFALDFKPISAGPYTISSIMASLGLTPPPNSRSTGTDADATVLLVETDSVVGLPNFSGDFVTTLASAISPATWTASMLLGIVESTDFHRVLQPGPFGSQTEYTLALSVISDAIPGIIEYGDVSSSAINDLISSNLATGQFVAEGNTTVTLNSPANPTGWMFSDKGDFAIAPVVIPEPSAIVMWGLLAAFGGIAFGRRQKRVKSEI